MRKQKNVRWLSAALAVSMMVFAMSPAAAYAAENETAETPISDSGNETDESEIIVPYADSRTEIAAAASYDEFLSALKILEGYANEYAVSSNEDAAGLIINYIRTGIEKYNTDSWATLAGKENTAFVSYVQQKDTENATNAQAVRGIGSFTIPNGQTVEFAHMFAAMNIAYYNNNAAVSADFGGWAGDICDLMEYTKGKVSSTDIESMAKEIKEHYLGIDDENAHSFGYRDIYGDLDAYYFMNQLTAGSGSFGTIMEGYFTEGLTDQSRAAFFLKNRFSGKTSRETIRTALLDAYKTNSGAIMLEAERNLSSDDTLRTACCYAFADYLYELAKDELSEGRENPYYTVFSSSSQTLAPGIMQDIKYALTADDQQIVYYIATVDVARDDVSIYANYKNNDGSSWGMSRVTDQMAAAQKKHSNPEDTERYIENYTPIVGVNADFYDMTTGQPSGALVMEGVEYHGTGSENFFAILDDGTPIIGGNTEWNAYKGRIREAVGGSAFLVKDGKMAVSTNANYYSSRASRTCVGITAEGKVVLMVLDGRQTPFSAGGSAEEIAQIMLDAGCVTAINLDGGGSSTYAAKEEGSDTVTVVNRPSDGYERSVSSSLLVVSTAKSSTEFDHALLSTETDYLTVGSSLEISAFGVSASGNAADIPAGAALRVSDETIGTITDGVFTAAGLGDVTAEMVLDGTVIGSKTLHVVKPDSVSFTKTEMNVVYGVETPLPITASYQGNPVTIQPADVEFILSNSAAGTMNGFAFTGEESSGIRAVTITAVLKADRSKMAEISLSLYKNGEAIFDFDNTTEGDSSFAWNRDVANSTTTDEKYYHIVDPNQAMDISYIFALDMKEIQIPEQLKPLISLLPGGDSADATAWGFLLQLAERVSVLTEVRIQLTVDENLDIDYSGMTLVNEYFTLTNTEFDEETHTLTVICNWKNQTQAIDPDTANSICILSGIKAVPKADAQWDENNCLHIINNGRIDYDIYLRSGTLYSVARSESIQQQYGIYPFVNPNDPTEKGGHFGTTFKTFEDSFTLDKTILQGWVKSGDNLYYFVDNVPVTGNQKVPGYQEEENEYYYSFDENGVCQGKITGLFEMDGAMYYAVNGAAKSGWRIIADENGNDQYYFFDYETYQAADGTQKIDGYTYVFENHKLVRGQLVTDTTGTRYRWAGAWLTNKWQTIDGNTYYFGQKGYAMTGIFHPYNIYIRYVADENGIWQEDHTGLYENGADTYYCENGVIVVYPGLVKIGEDYYYFNSSDKAVKNRSYWITKTNGLLPEGNYTFDENGKMINPPDPDSPVVKNGIVEESGSLYYYVDGVRSYAGLIQIDGDYYYVKTSSGEVVHGRSYWITKTNGLLPEGNYTFDESGKMINPPDPNPPVVKNGIVEENGSLYYYVDGVRSYAGLIQIDGDYYYVKTSSGEVVHGRSYWVTRTNDLLPEGNYTFDETGKMVR